jgi:tRNA pseudouridine55 synthase
MGISSGFIIINKPAGPTSHDIINYLRRITSIKKIGHAGTLDPFAEGLLLVAIGRDSTKRLGEFLKMDKEYAAGLNLGSVSDTLDVTGKIENKNQAGNFKEKDIEEELKKFVGWQDQIPPMYSAKKIKGKKLYELARKGITIERQPSKINIYSLKLIDYKWPDLNIEVACSSGTYIRTLADDIGRSLGCGAYLKSLTRIKLGEFYLRDAVVPEKLNENNWTNFLFNIPD